MDEEKHESPLKQLDRVCLFMTMFPLIFTIYSTNVRSFPLHLVSSWFPPGGWSESLLPSGHDHKCEVDASIQEIRAQRPAAPLSLCDALNRTAAGEEALSTAELKWRRRRMLEKQLAWGLQAGPLTSTPPPISPHSDSVTYILGRPWHSCKRGEKMKRGQHNPRASVIQGRLIHCPTTQRVILRQLGEY